MTKPPIRGLHRNAPDIADVPCERCGGVGVEPTSWPDTGLFAAYQRTDGVPGNPEADALLLEVERRGLDV